MHSQNIEKKPIYVCNQYGFLSSLELLNESILSSRPQQRQLVIYGFWNSTSDRGKTTHRGFFIGFVVPSTPRFNKQLTDRLLEFAALFLTSPCSRRKGEGDEVHEDRSEEIDRIGEASRASPSGSEAGVERTLSAACRAISPIKSAMGRPSRIA